MAQPFPSRELNPASAMVLKIVVMFTESALACQEKIEIRLHYHKPHADREGWTPPKRYDITFTI
jgi:hypothetical protein